MKLLRRAFFVVFLLCGAFLGHELAYALHFGVLGALPHQSSGVHRYFLPVGELAASLLLGMLSLFLVLVVLISSSIQVRRPRLVLRDVVRRQVVLFAGQLGLYFVQECVEASLARPVGFDLGSLLLYGLRAQAVIAASGGWLFALVWAPVEATVAAYERVADQWEPRQQPWRLAVGCATPGFVSTGLTPANSPRAPPPPASFGSRRAA